MTSADVNEAFNRATILENQTVSSASLVPASVRLVREIEKVSNYDGNFLFLLWIQVKDQAWEFERASNLGVGDLRILKRQRWNYDTVQLKF